MGTCGSRLPPRRRDRRPQGGSPTGTLTGCQPAPSPSRTWLRQPRNTWLGGISSHAWRHPATLRNRLILKQVAGSRLSPVGRFVFATAEVPNPRRRSNNAASLTLAQIAGEINAGRPVVADIIWNSGGSHSVAIAVVQDEGLLILDPINGQSLIEFGVFPATYFGGAALDGYAFSSR